MSTLAYRDGNIAADTQGTNGNLTYVNVTKIAALERGGLIGAVGLAGYAAEIVAWAATWNGDTDKLGTAEADVPRPEEDSAALVVRPDGKAFLIEHFGAPIPVEEAFIALGSGSGVALGAMAMGATAAEAVRIACRFDVYSGGRITSLSLSPRQPPKGASA